MAVDRADVGEAELLEERATGSSHAGHQAVRPARAGAERLGQGAREAVGDLLQRDERCVGVEPRQVFRHRPDRRGDRHLVVVEDDEHPPLLGAGVVHRLVGHAGRDRPVADHRHHVAGRLAEVARHGEAEARRDRGRGMRRAEGVVGALAALGEAGQPAALPQRADAAAAPGDDLVRIALVADVPDQLVVGRVEDRVDRHGQLDHPEARAEMPAGLRHHRDQLLAQFVRDGGELGVRHAAQVGGAVHAVEQRGLRAIGLG